MINGRFDLEDFLEQLKQIKKLWILKLMPGANNISKDKINTAGNKFMLFKILISYTTKEEKKFPKLLKRMLIEKKDN